MRSSIRRFSIRRQSRRPSIAPNGQADIDNQSEAQEDNSQAIKDIELLREAVEKDVESNTSVQQEGDAAEDKKSNSSSVEEERRASVNLDSSVKRRRRSSVKQMKAKKERTPWLLQLLRSDTIAGDCMKLSIVNILYWVTLFALVFVCDWHLDSKTKYASIFIINYAVLVNVFSMCWTIFSGHLQDSGIAKSLVRIGGGPGCAIILYYFNIHDINSEEEFHIGTEFLWSAKIMNEVLNCVFALFFVTVLTASVLQFLDSV